MISLLQLLRRAALEPRDRARERIERHVIKVIAPQVRAAPQALSARPRRWRALAAVCALSLSLCS